MTLTLDADDERDINAAIAHYQATCRWESKPGEDGERMRHDGTPAQGVFLPEGESDLAGAVLGEICRDWLESRGVLRQEG